MAVVIGLLAFSIRNIGLGCCALKQVTYAHFIGVVALWRFGSPLRRQITREGILEVLKDVALRCLVADADGLRSDAERPQHRGQLIRGERLLVFAKLGPRPPLYRDQSRNN